MEKMIQTESKIQPFWIVVLELEDVVPRRHLSKPNLYVGRTVSPPEKQFEAELKRKGHKWYSDAIVRLRPDLAPKRQFTNRDSSTRALEKVTQKLSQAGYTVNRDTRVWSVYVIELDSNAISNPGRGFVYVGQTSLSPEERFTQHVRGIRNKKGPLYSRVAHRHGVRLRPDLAPRRKFFEEKSAKEAEKRRREILEKRGFVVRGGH